MSRFQQAKKSAGNTRSLSKYEIYIEKQHTHICSLKWWAVLCLLSVLTLKRWEGPSSWNVFMSTLFAPQFFYRNSISLYLSQNKLYSITKFSLVLKFSNVTTKVLKINYISHMQNARSKAAISRASEGYHFSHDALLTCKLPIEQLKKQISDGTSIGSNRQAKFQWTFPGPMDPLDPTDTFVWLSQWPTIYMTSISLSIRHSKTC
jgi:hypothetical protein